MSLSKRKLINPSLTHNFKKNRAIPRHFITDNTLIPPFPENLHQALFGFGCFWGSERKFWQQPGVFSTAVGFTGGHIVNPSYEEVCGGLTGHNEVVLIVYDPEKISYHQLLIIFWESHNPTQGMRQGNDLGTQYRSGIYTFNTKQHDLAIQSLNHYQNKLDEKEIGKITTEIINASSFYYAENYHQQYLAKNPTGYCGLGGLEIQFE